MDLTDMTIKALSESVEMNTDSYSYLEMYIMEQAHKVLQDKGYIPNIRIEENNLNKIIQYVNESNVKKLLKPLNNCIKKAVDDIVLEKI